ncbi:MAG: PASTA domain-containing protein, partial [Terracidiphilus sp.]
LRLRRAGLEVGVTARLPYAGAQDGTVLAQDPPGHSQGIAQPSVNILVAAPDGVAPDGYVMPDLTGIPIITAQLMLNKIGLKVDTPTYADVFVPDVSTGPEQAKPPIIPGVVIAQQPMAGARVDQTTMIRLTAAK